MNKPFICVSAFAVGLAGLQAAPVQSGLSALERSKPWSVSASLRGFYDDNHLTLPNDVKRDSFGVEVVPSASLNLPLDQTFIGLSYIYSMRWYEDRDDDPIDHSHQFNAKLDHAFSERYKVELSDSFVIAQEPLILDSGVIISAPLRREGDNLRNTASGNFTAQLTQLLGLQIGYQNTVYDYEEEGAGSYSASLDRVEHLASANLRWHLQPQTVGILGYQFGATEYTSDDPLAQALLFGFIPISFGDPADRDNRAHYFFAGVDQNINSRLNASLRLGGRYTEYFNVDRDDLSPYADASLSYTYAQGSYLQVGVRHDRNATDVTAPTFLTGFSSSDLTVDQQSTSAYASLTHRFTERIRSSLLGQYQRSQFEGGGFDGEVDNFFIAGLSLEYRLNMHWSAETGYNFDRLDSDIPGRSYTRNRVYVGIRATY